MGKWKLKYTQTYLEIIQFGFQTNEIYIDFYEFRVTQWCLLPNKEKRKLYKYKYIRIMYILVLGKILL